jgi:hypothetical protein
MILREFLELYYMIYTDFARFLHFNYNAFNCLGQLMSAAAYYTLGELPLDRPHKYYLQI